MDISHAGPNETSLGVCQMESVAKRRPLKANNAFLNMEQGGQSSTMFHLGVSDSSGPSSLYTLHTLHVSSDITADTDKQRQSSTLRRKKIKEGTMEFKVDMQSEDPSYTHGNTSQVLIQDRDPRGINKNLKVTFEDVIAEPPSVRSFDKVWLWSHALFEVARLWCYRFISLLLAVPLSLAAGLLLAVLSCLHIWLIMPCVQLLLINMHWVRTVWSSILNILISPYFSSIGQCCSRITIHLARHEDR